MAKIRLHLLSGGTVDLETMSIKTVAADTKGSIVVTQKDGKVSGTYKVYESPCRINHAMSDSFTKKPLDS